MHSMEVAVVWELLAIGSVPSVNVLEEWNNNF